MKPLRNIRGMTAGQSAAIHAHVAFLHEALDAREAILEWRKGSGPVPVPWPAWVKADLPPGVGPDLCRWDWEDISARGKALRDACFPIVKAAYGDEYDDDNPHRELAAYFYRLLLGHGSAYRQIRYSWYLTGSPDWRARIDQWATDTRAHLNALPLEDEPLA